MKKSTMAGIGAAAVLAMAALAAGCGGSSDSASGSSTDTTTTTTPTTTGGTARYALQSDADFTDPALAYYSVSWNIEYATCAKLLNYPDTAGIPGAELQPEVAESMPTLSNGDKTYTFTVRDGLQVLAAVRRARHRDDLQEGDRARPEQGDELAGAVLRR